MKTELSPITRLLEAVSTERDGAMDELMTAVYDDLHGMAVRRMWKMFGAKLAGVTLEPAALVNETVLRLIQQQASFTNRHHFFAIISRLMLRVLIDYQRQRNAAKRPDPAKRITLSLCPATDSEPSGSCAIDIEAFEHALERLESRDRRKADVVRMRVIWTMTHAQIAESLAVSLATVRRDWRFARTWLLEELDQMSNAEAAAAIDST